MDPFFYEIFLLIGMISRVRMIPMIPTQPILMIKIMVTPIRMRGKEVDHSKVNNLVSMTARSLESRLLILPSSDDLIEWQVIFEILA